MSTRVKWNANRPRTASVHADRIARRALMRIFDCQCISRTSLITVAVLLRVGWLTSCGFRSTELKQRRGRPLGFPASGQRPYMADYRIVRNFRFLIPIRSSGNPHLSKRLQGTLVVTRVKVGKGEPTPSHFLTCSQLHDHSEVMDSGSVILGKQGPTASMVILS